MRSLMVGATGIALALLAMTALPALGGSPAEVFRRTHSAGGVAVMAVYAPPEYFALTDDRKGAERFRPAEQIVFLLTFDTHSGDLTTYDVLQNIRLRTSAGKTYAPVRWESISADSHHRAGALIFRRTANGAAVVGPEVTRIALVIANLAGVPSRVVEWTLPIR